MKAYLPKGSSFPFRLRLLLTRSIPFPGGLDERRRAVTPDRWPLRFHQCDGANQFVQLASLIRVASWSQSSLANSFVSWACTARRLGLATRRERVAPFRRRSVPAKAYWLPKLRGLHLPGFPKSAHNPTHNPPLFLFLSISTKPDSLSNQTTLGKLVLHCSSHLSNQHTARRGSSPLWINLETTSPEFMYGSCGIIPL